MDRIAGIARIRGRSRAAGRASVGVVADTVGNQGSTRVRRIDHHEVFLGFKGGSASEVVGREVFARNTGQPCVSVAEEVLGVELGGVVGGIVCTAEVDRNGSRSASDGLAQHTHRHTSRADWAVTVVVDHFVRTHNLVVERGNLTFQEVVNPGVGLAEQRLVVGTHFERGRDFRHGAERPLVNRLFADHTDASRLASQGGKLTSNHHHVVHIENVA